MSSKDAAFPDVPDSTDWKSTQLPQFEGVEAPLRCQVCKEFITTPMMTSCGHTFCSACIRRSLANDGHCPACRTKDQELKLRPNKSMEEVVEAFMRAREAAMEVAQLKAEEKLEVVQVLQEAQGGQKRKRSRAERSESTEPRRTRTSTRISSRTTPQASYEAIDMPEENDEDYTPGDGLVACPMCEKRMKTTEINKHLDDIHFNPAPKQTSTLTSFTPQSPLKYRKEPPLFEPKPLPTLSYNLFNDKKLAAKLRDLGIPAHGNKPQMERRHREWLTLWNSNCDATRPKPKRELLKKLDEWERTQNSLFPSSRGSKESQVSNKEFDGKGWASAHSDDFNDLVANARRNVKKEENAALAQSQPKTNGIEKEMKAQEPVQQPSWQPDGAYVDGLAFPVSESAPSDYQGLSSGQQADTSAPFSGTTVEQERQQQQLDSWWNQTSQNLGQSSGEQQPSFQDSFHQPSQQQDEVQVWNGQQQHAAWTNDFMPSLQQHAQPQDINSTIDPALGAPLQNFNFDAFLGTKTAGLAESTKSNGYSAAQIDALLGYPQAQPGRIAQTAPPLQPPQHTLQRAPIPAIASRSAPPSHPPSPSGRSLTQRFSKPTPERLFGGAPLQGNIGMRQPMAADRYYQAGDQGNLVGPFRELQSMGPTGPEDGELGGNFSSGLGESDLASSPNRLGEVIPLSGTLGESGVSHGGLGVALIHEDLRNRDGSQMTPQQKLEILRRPYRRTGGSPPR